MSPKVDRIVCRYCGTLGCDGECDLGPVPEAVQTFKRGRNCSICGAPVKALTVQGKKRLFNYRDGFAGQHLTEHQCDASKIPR